MLNMVTLPAFLICFVVLANLVDVIVTEIRSRKPVIVVKDHGYGISVTDCQAVRIDYLLHRYTYDHLFDLACRLNVAVPSCKTKIQLARCIVQQQDR